MCAKIRISKKQSPRTVKHNNDFRTVGKGVHLLFNALHGVLKDFGKDHQLTGRLMARLMQIIKTDNSNEAGNRKLNKSDLTLLGQFEFFQRLPFLRFARLPAIRLDRENGRCAIIIDEYKPIEWLPRDCSTTHVTIVAAATEIDFDQACFSTFTGKSTELPVSMRTDVKFDFEAPKGSSLPVIVVVGMKLWTIINGHSYLSAWRPLMIAKVDMPHATY